MDTNDQVNVLLVDDQPAKLLSYEVMLSSLGERLLKAASAKEALETLLRNEIAVVLIDVCMPELDGFELAAMIREHPRFQRTAIIFVSAVHIAEGDYLKGYDAGAVDYVPVPVVPEVLRAKVRIFAELFRKTKQLERLNRELEDRVAERTAALELSTGKLVESERARTLALAAGRMGSWSYVVAEKSWSWDEGLSNILGLSDVGDHAGPYALSAFFSEPDRAQLQAAALALSPENNTFQLEMRLQRQDGSERVCHISAGARFDAARALLRLDGVAIDITDRKEAEMRQELLAREVDHRARNTLAVVQSIVRMTTAGSMAAYRDAVEGRIRALAHAQELLSQSRWQGADIVRLVTEEVAPYRIGDPQKVTVQGPSVILPPDKAQALGLSLHELATNAAKYGALSLASGRVHIEWQLEDGVLTLLWLETGASVKTAPKREGFGSKIINASITGQCGGKVQYEWRTDGLHCTLSLPHCGAVSSGATTASLGSRKARHETSSVATILLLEDEALLGLMMRDMLTEIGYEVMGPFNGIAAAAAVLERESPAAAVLDVNLRGEIVYGLADELEVRGVPCVFVTGYAKDGIDSRFAHVPVLQKPLTREALERVLNTLLAPRSAETPRLTA